MPFLGLQCSVAAVGLPLQPTAKTAAGQGSLATCMSAAALPVGAAPPHPAPPRCGCTGGAARAASGTAWTAAWGAAPAGA